MLLFPIFLNIKGRSCLVIGGGAVAERKVRNLLECQARIIMVSPQAARSLEELAEKGELEWRRRNYSPDDLDGVFLVFIATDNPAVNRQVMEHCQEKGIMFNAADDPPNCDFFVPSVIRRKSLSIAISTGGKSPLMARRLREQLEEQIPAEYGQWVEMMGKLRDYIQNRVEDTHLRQRLYRYLIEPDMWECIKNGQEEIIRERIDKCISSWRA